MHTVNAELVESLQHFITIWRLIGKPFPQVDATDRPGLAISWRSTHMDLSRTKAISQYRPQRQSSTQAASFCSWWQRRQMHGAKAMGKQWCVMPCKKPTRRPASDGPCCMLGSPGSRARCLRTCTGSLTARDSGAPRDFGAPDGAFRFLLQRRRPGVIFLRG